MLSKEINAGMQRKNATCKECSNLMVSCNPEIRDRILSTQVKVCDYAKWGCMKYHGGTDNSLIGPREGMEYFVYRGMKVGETFTIQSLAMKLDLDRQIVTNNLGRMIRKGVPIRKQRIDGILHFTLIR